ncbi:MAG: HAD family hydrolase [Clostridia bacterium]|nr:HAD family hydrolase [Clostridia bacterium]
MIKAIVFDFDHTLYDRSKTFAAATDDFIALCGDRLRPELSREEITALICRSDYEGVYNGAWKKSYQLLADYGIYREEPLPYEIYHDDFVRGAFPRAIKLFEDTVDTLKALRAEGYRLGMLTNGYIKYQTDKLQTNPEILPYFDVIRISEEIGYQKPHPRAFLDLSGRLGLKPHEIAFVGDNPISDICGARSIGMLPIWMRYVKEWQDCITPPPYSIDRLSELPLLLRKINGRSE